MSAALPGSELSLINSGSIRLDDELSGQITQYDILRALPFGGKLLEVAMRGDLLEKVLTIGTQTNRGTGGYLQTDRVQYNTITNQWIIGREPLRTDRTYRVALSDYLLTGLETNLDFLKPDHPGIVQVYPADSAATGTIQSDIRLAVIEYLKAGK